MKSISRKSIVAVVAAGALGLTAILGGGAVVGAVATPSPSPVPYNPTLHAPYTICGGGDGYSYVQCSQPYGVFAGQPGATDHGSSFTAGQPGASDQGNGPKGQ